MITPHAVPPYNPALTLRKALLTWLAGSLVAGSTLAAVKWPQSLHELKASWPSLLIPALLGLLRAFQNWRKHNPRNQTL